MVLLGGSSEKERKRKGEWRWGCGGVCNKKQGNNPVKMHPLDQTKGSANTHM